KSLSNPVIETRTSHKQYLSSSRLPRPTIISPHLPLPSLNPLHPLPPTIPLNTPFLRPLPLPFPYSFPFLLLLLINLDNPIILNALIRPLMPPFRHPFPTRLVILHLLPCGRCLRFNTF